jgi:hypothetical protein
MEPDHAMVHTSCRTMPDHAGPCRTMPWSIPLAGPCRTMPDHAGPCRTMPDHAGPCRTMPWSMLCTPCVAVRPPTRMRHDTCACVARTPAASAPSGGPACATTRLRYGQAGSACMGLARQAGPHCRLALQCGAVPSRSGRHVTRHVSVMQSASPSHVSAGLRCGTAPLDRQLLTRNDPRHVRPCATGDQGEAPRHATSVT